MASDSEDSEGEELSMIRPGLIRELKNVLDEYPDDGQIFKEMIQNAEDAGAKVVKILSDRRHFHRDLDPKTQRKHPHLDSLQGPALVVYNDANFTEDDWKGIRMLHTSVKEKDPLKVGRFGLGFKSVFHLTDRLVILSGDHIMYMDPFKGEDRYCKRKKIESLKGRELKSVLHCVEGVFGVTRQAFGAVGGHFTGTMFWFPLRQAASELSNTIYTDKKMQELINAFKAESSAMLIFLKNIEQVEVFSSDQNQDIREVFAVGLAGVCRETVRSERQKFLRGLQAAGCKLPDQGVGCITEVTIGTTDHVTPSYDTQHWLVVNYHPGKRDVSGELAELCADSELAYRPYVGVAIPLDDQRHFQSQIFCFLPLPLQLRSPTGLPVHVNGYFALSQNRRHLKWPTKDQMSLRAALEAPIRWNCLMVKELLPRAYTLLLGRLKTIHWQNPLNFYSAWPDANLVVDMWRPLMDPVYNMVAKENSFHTQARGGDWIGLRQAVLRTFSSQTTPDVQSSVVKVYVETGQNLVALPHHIEEKLRQLELLHEVITITHHQTSQLIPSCLESLSNIDKLHMLLYLSSHDDAVKLLSSQHLLPLADGTFGVFAEAVTYWCEERLLRLFPGLERRFCSCDAHLPPGLRDLLRKLAQSGHLSLSVLRDNDVETVASLMQDSLQQRPGMDQPSLPSNDPWLQQVWQFLSSTPPWNRDLSALGHVSLLPCQTETAITLFPLNGLYVCRAARGLSSLPSDLCGSLTKLFITVLPQLPEYITHSGVFGDRVQYPTPEGVVAVLVKLSDDYALRDSAISRFNQSASRQEIEAVVTFLADNTTSLKGAVGLLRDLELFTARGNNRLVSLKKLDMIGPECSLPVEPKLPLLSCTSASKRAAVRLGAKEMSLKQIVGGMLESSSQYTISELTELMKFFLSRQDLVADQSLLSSAQKVQFLTTSSGQLRAAKELYDPSCRILLEVFDGEDKFPCGQFANTDMLKKLRKLGLRTDRTVKPPDLLQAAINTEQLCTSGSTQAAVRKAEGLWTFLINHGDIPRDILNSISQVQCLPCLQPESVPSDYPSSLPIKSDPRIVRPVDMCWMKHVRLIGSVVPIARSNLPENLGKCLHVGNKVNVKHVLQHLKTIVHKFSVNEVSQYSLLLSDIFKFLNKHSSIRTVKQTLQMSECVLVESGELFCRPDKLWVVQNGDTDISVLKPYRFPMPKSLEPAKDLLLQCGACERQDEFMLQAVLEEIRDSQVIHPPSRANCLRDLQLVKQILDVLKRNESIPKGTVLLPIEHSQAHILKFRPAGECTVGTAPWKLEDGVVADEEEMYFFVHHEVHIDTARTLGALEIRQRALTGVEDLDFGYEQREELTTRLHNLLEESYTDGFSVPKELIQNADDAGATEVRFLLDERENRDARSGLISDNMATLQGPAIWAYNDATFTDTDFENIVKLGAGTKKDDASKVGRFGLGFNTVYNLTDVPSFISRHSMAIFDPHVRYLPKGAGLKLDFRRQVNRSLLSRMPNQFMPYQEVFGCRLHNDQNVFFDGTLFRFPLRTAEQADESEIKTESYSQKKRREFLRMLLERAGSLLMFTQSVQKIQVFYLPATCTKPGDALCLLTVTRSCQSRYLVPRADQFQDTILQHCTTHWPNDIRILEKVTVTLDVESEARAVCDVEQIHVTTHWKLAWATGTGDSEKAARQHGRKGFVPLATVAISLCPENTIQALSDIPFGFYPSGHLFCFLPLPKEMVAMSLPVHVNGTFDLTSSRRSLLIRTEDDLGKGEIDWNAALFGDAVCRAYLLLLESLHTEAVRDRDYSRYFELWPVSGETSLDTNFYRRLVSDGNQVLPVPGQGQWVAFQEACFLDPDFRQSECGQLAWNAVNRFWDGQGGSLVDLPAHLCRLIQSSGNENAFKARVITKLKFYQRFFFPNIESDYWQPADRDELVLHALMESDPEIHNLLSVQACVPCEQSSQLKRPGDLIHPSMQASSLFLPSEGRFPQDAAKKQSEKEDKCKVNFCALQCLSRLDKLGMIVDELPIEMVIERAKSVKLLLVKDRKAALQRASNLIEYLAFVKSSFKSRLQTYDPEMRDKLLHIDWLPVLRKPDDWPFPWKGNEGPELSAPRELFSDSLKDLVACTEKVLDSNAIGNSKYNKTSLQSLEVQMSENYKEKRMADIVIEQLKKVADSHDKDLNCGRVRKLCNNIYDFLNRHLSETDNAHISNELSQARVIWMGDQFVSASQVAFTCEYECHPYLFQLEGSLQGFKILFREIGVKERFNTGDAVAVLEKIQSDHPDYPLNEDDISLVSRVAQLLCSAMKLTAEDSLPDEVEVFLPDLQGYMLSTKTLCLNDCPWLKESETMRFVHESISPESARALGVETKRGKDFDELMRPIPFGQHEKLTTRIKRLLEGYTCDSSLFKELLQNADDAGATEIRFILDTRTLGTEKVPAGWSEHLQGPALCVYNNKSFTSNDMEGIQNLGQGSKGEDLLKTGQYGVGFNAVYNITDVPSFWTLENDTQEVICVFDPNCCYVRNTNLMQPGVKLCNIARVRQQYPDMFAGYLGDSFNMSNPGTMFRFPLRTQTMADTSELKQPAVTTYDIKKLLLEFEAETKNCLLFLNNLQMIQIYHTTDAGALRLHYEAEKCVQNCSTRLQEEFKMRLADASRRTEDVYSGLQDIPVFEAVVQMTLKDTNCEEEWLTVNRVGFAEGENISDKLLAEWKEKHFRLLPRGGVAVKLSQKVKTERFGAHLKSDHYRVFCILPLPWTTTTDTGLLLHVNGHFVLDHETRRNLWENNRDAKTEWNMTIIQQVVVPAFVTAIQELKHTWFTSEIDPMRLTDMLNKYHAFFPDLQQGLPEYWKGLIEGFYRKIGEIPVFPVTSVKQLELVWVPAINPTGFPGYFSNLVSFYEPKVSKSVTLTHGSVYRASTTHNDTKKAEKEADDMKILLKKLNMKVLEMPFRVFDAFKNSGVEAVQEVTPTVVIEFLKSTDKDGCSVKNLPRAVAKTPFETVCNVQSLIKFVKQDPEFLSRLNGLPLSLRQSEELFFFHQLSDEQKPIVSKYCQLLPGSAQAFLHVQIHGYFLPLSDQMQDMLREFDIPLLSHLLKYTLQDAHFTSGSACLLDAKTLPQPKWLCDLWEFIETKLAKEKADGCDDVAMRVRMEEKLTCLARWSLIPAKTKTGRDQVLLYPIKYMHHVLHLSETPEQTNQKMWEILQNLPLAFLDTSFLPKKSVVSQIVASIGHPLALLHALTSCKRSLTSSHNSAYEILAYFSTNLKVLQNSGATEHQLKTELRSLPLFLALDDNLTDVLESVPTLCLKSKLPKNGLMEWSRKRSDQVVLLRKRGVPDELRHFVGFKKMSSEDFYIHFLLPSIDFLPSDSILTQMTAVKTVWEHMSEEERQPLTSQLRRTAFIERDGHLHLAEDFYSPFEPVFAAMCPKLFPLKPYCDADWRDFMKAVGIISEVTDSMFLRFARSLEEMGRTGISKDLLWKSDTLVSYLFRRDELFEGNLLYQVKDVAFIRPSKWSETPEGKLLGKIVQHFSKNRLVSFGESCREAHAYLAWSSSSILHEKANLCSRLHAVGGKQQKVVQSTFPFMETATKSKVILHFTNLCRALAEPAGLKIFASLNQEDLLVVETAIDQLYNYLRTVDQLDLAQFNDLPVICDLSNRQMLKAENVILDLRDEEAITGRIQKAPREFGKYFDLFKKLGVAERVTVDHYAKVLACLKTEADGESLHVEEMKIVKKAVEGVFRCLKSKTEDERKMTVGELYLPSESEHLEVSSGLTFKDDVIFGERLHEPPSDICFFIGFDALEIEVQLLLSEVNLLPEKYRMKLLSEIVKEVLTESSRNTAREGSHSMAFFDRLSQSSCITAIVRLAYHNNRQNAFNDETVERIAKNIRAISVKETPNLRTVLKVSGTIAQESECGKLSFVERVKTEPRSCVVYLDQGACCDMERNMVAFIRSFAYAVSFMVSFELSTDLLHEVLRYPDRAQRLLDECHIVRCDFKDAVERSVFLRAGTFVRIDHHCYLDNNFYEFYKGEHVGYEVYDPAVDSLNTQGEDAVYIYAIVIEEVKQERQGDTPLLARQYRVNLGHERGETVVSVTQLYKFVRKARQGNTKELVKYEGPPGTCQEEALPTDLAAVLREIRKTLTDAWKLLDEDGRRRVVKRLYLKWHPDKNPGREEFCTRVVQALQRYVDLLKEGKSLPDGEDDTSGSYKSTSSYSSFFDHMHRRGRAYRDHYESNARSGSRYDGGGSGGGGGSNPQPMEGHRWFQQAKADLAAAQKAKGSCEEGYNWICYMCHQAVEKALISILYRQDADSSFLQSHELEMLARVVGNAGLIQLTSKLVVRLGFHRRMRYPDMCSFPRIPANVFTETDATFACDIAARVIDGVNCLS